jgi:purine-binding chemotaxis protein CheW
MQTQPESHANGAADASGTEQLLTFIINDAEYGVDILRVQEIRGWSLPLPLPQTPSYVKGVINIRGSVVPVADLRERLGLRAESCGPTTVIIVLRVTIGQEEEVMGIIVDAMSDVTSVGSAEIKPTPTFGASCASGIARGIVTRIDKMITILDVDRIFIGVADGNINGGDRGEETVWTEGVG